MVVIVARIRGEVAGAGHVWLKKLRTELVFQICSRVGLCQTRPISS
jgi:hypothetical protein